MEAGRPRLAGPFGSAQGRRARRPSSVDINYSAIASHMGVRLVLSRAPQT